MKKVNPFLFRFATITLYCLIPYVYNPFQLLDALESHTVVSELLDLFVHYTF